MSFQRNIWACRTLGEPSVPLHFEEGEGRTCLSVRSDYGVVEQQRGVAFLTELHLELFVEGSLHAVSLGRDPDRRQYVEAISMGREDARKRMAFAYDALMAETPLIEH